jgi:hypothetical protein
MGVVKQQHVAAAARPVPADALDERSGRSTRGRAPGPRRRAPRPGPGDRDRSDRRQPTRVRGVEVIDAAGPLASRCCGSSHCRLEDAHLVAAREQLGHDAAQEVRVAVVPVRDERVAEETTFAVDRAPPTRPHPAAPRPACEPGPAHARTRAEQPLELRGAARVGVLGQHRRRAAWPMRAARPRSAVRVRRDLLAVAATSTSRPGSRNCSIPLPGVRDETGPAPAGLEHARRRREAVARHAVAADVEHRRGVQLKALWSRVYTWPT